MKRGELAKKKRKGCLTALLVVWAVFIVKVIAVLNPGFPEAWRMVEAGQIAGFAYIWLLVFLVLLCCFVLWRIVPKGYFRKKKPETSRPAGEWAVSIPTHENPVVVGNPFRGIFIAGAAGSGKSESVAVPLLLEFIRKGFAGIVYDFKFPALDNDISSFLNATGSDLRHFRLNFSNPCTKITNCWLKGFMNLLFFCLIILKFSVYEIPSSFRTSSFADEKKPLQCLNSVFAFSKSSPCFLSVSKRA